MVEKSKSLNLILLFIIVYTLKVGQSIILPFVVAMFFWALIYILSSKYTQLFVEKMKLPLWTKHISRILAIITLATIIYYIVIGIKGNIDGVATTFGSYQKNMSVILQKMQNYFGIKQVISIENILKEINIPTIINSVIQNVASFFKASIMIFIYLIFILLEEKSFYKKFPKLFSTKKKEKEVLGMVNKIYSKFEIYISVKLFTSLLTAILGYVVMTSVKLDFALFWAILMFLFNFIPTVGSIISSAFPILLALLQFSGDLVPVSIVAIGIVVIQLAIGNFVDPKIMGKRLNLSPLVLILSLVIWGSIWGIIGMFLCVPIMIVLTIILHQFRSTKKIAILLTEDGEDF